MEQFFRRSTLRFLTLAGAAVILPAASLAAKAANEAPADNVSTPGNAAPGKMREDVERDRRSLERDSRESRVALEQWAGCVARNNAGEAARVLAMDFTKPTYGRALRMLSEEDKMCMSFRGTLRSAGLLFAGEMAETLLEDGGAPLGPRLARAATRDAVTTYTFTDSLAMCLVRSVPDQVAAVFATGRGSEEEKAAIGALGVPAQMCAKAVRTAGQAGPAGPKANEAPRPVSISPAALRAMLATASFRSIAALKAA